MRLDPEEVKLFGKVYAILQVGVLFLLALAAPWFLLFYFLKG